MKVASQNPVLSHCGVLYRFPKPHTIYLKCFDAMIDGDRAPARLSRWRLLRGQRLENYVF